ncbi:hypothetical protein BaRGS_00001046 [Batillaria attramentaria]|uniref:Uncharacterized protein n=1 Tax=Batillaria attramentaria TaxID=370345 RepID=A0ABD0M9K8_9CAEN
MFETYRRAHLSHEVHRKHVTWKAQLPGESEEAGGIDDPQWYRVRSNFCNLPSIVLVEEVAIPRVKEGEKPKSRVKSLEGKVSLKPETGKWTKMADKLKSRYGATRRLELSTEGFWEFLYSDRWKETCLLRVLEGELLDNLLAALYLLQRDHDVISYVTIAYIENKYQKMPPLACVRVVWLEPDLEDPNATGVEQVLVELDYFSHQDRSDQLELIEAHAKEKDSKICSPTASPRGTFADRTTIHPAVCLSAPSQLMSAGGRSLAGPPLKAVRSASLPGTAKFAAFSLATKSRSLEHASLCGINTSLPLPGSSKDSVPRASVKPASVCVTGGQSQFLPGNSRAGTIEPLPFLSETVGSVAPTLPSVATSPAITKLQKHSGQGRAGTVTRLPLIKCNMRGLKPPPPHASCLKPYHMLREPFLLRRGRTSTILPSVELPYKEELEAGLTEFDTPGSRKASSRLKSAELRAFSVLLDEEIEMAAEDPFLERIAEEDAYDVESGAPVKGRPKAASFVARPLIPASFAEQQKWGSQLPEDALTGQQAIRVQYLDDNDIDDNVYKVEIDQARVKQFQDDLTLMCNEFHAGPHFQTINEVPRETKLRGELGKHRDLRSPSRDSGIGISPAKAANKKEGKRYANRECAKVKTWMKCPTFAEFYQYLEEDEPDVPGVRKPVKASGRTETKQAKVKKRESDQATAKKRESKPVKQVRRETKVDQKKRLDRAKSATAHKRETLMKRAGLVAGQEDTWHLSVRFAYLAGGVCDSVGVRNALLRRREMLLNKLKELKAVSDQPPPPRKNRMSDFDDSPTDKPLETKKVVTPDDRDAEEELFKLMGFQRIFDVKKLNPAYCFEKMFAHRKEMVFVVRKERATTTRQFKSKVSVTFTRRRTAGGADDMVMTEARRVVAGVCQTLEEAGPRPGAGLVPC